MPPVIKNTLQHLVSDEKTNFGKNKCFEKRDMTSFILEDNFEYLEIQKHSPTENVKEYYLCIKEYFDLFFPIPDHI